MYIIINYIVYVYKKKLQNYFFYALLKLLKIYNKCTLYISTIKSHISLFYCNKYMNM